MIEKYQQYLLALTKPFKKLARIDFLQPDNSIAFSLDNNYKRGYNIKYDTRAFIQSGSLSVSLQNGQRRRATITLSNLDGAFDYAVNKIWFGQRVRLLMGLVLPDGTDFYLPQGVFYISNPSNAFNPNQRTVTFNLVDKWSYLDGSLFGRLSSSYLVPRNTTEKSIWEATTKLLKFSKIDFEPTNDISLQIDNVTPIYTTFYDRPNKPEGAIGSNVPYEIRVSGENVTLAQIILELNNIIVGWVGYDQTGALRIDASQNDVEDVNKPVLWNFTPENSQLLGISETIKNSEVYNDIIIVGQTQSNTEIYGRVSNYDAKSDTNINLIGRRTYKESQSNYSNVQQCIDLAEFRLKRKTILQKTVTIRSSQLFHLTENSVITIKRTDKEGSPIERHLIQSFTLPIGETGEMSISCLSVNDLPNLITQVSTGV